MGSTNHNFIFFETKIGSVMATHSNLNLVTSSST